MADISKPDQIIIEDGYSLGDVKTIEDCDEARVILTDIVANMECQLDQYPEGPESDPSWRARAKKALRWKKLAMQFVMERRAELMRAKLKTDLSFLENDTNV